MNDNDWWARKLGGGAPAPGPPPTPSRPAQARPGQPQQPQYEATPPADTSEVPDIQNVRQGFALMDAGGKYVEIPNAAKHGKANGRCPGCGGENYYAPVAENESGMPMRGPAPAARCLDCGYPLIQSGSPLGALTGVKPDAARPAPQATTTAGFEGKLGELGTINPMTGEFTPRAQ